MGPFRSRPATGDKSAVGKGRVGKPAIRCGPHVASQRHMRGHRIKPRLESPAARRGVLRNLLTENPGPLAAQTIHIVVIITVLGCAGEQALSEDLIFGEIARERRHQILRFDLLLLVHQILQRREGIRHVGDLHALWPAEVVVGAACCHIHSHLQAIVNHGREERRLAHASVQSINNAGALNHQGDEMAQVLREGRLEFGKGDQLLQTSRRWPKAPSRLRLDASVEREFEHADQIEHRRVAPSEGFARDGKLDAADHGIIHRVRVRHPAMLEGGDNNLVVKELRHPRAEADHARHRPSENHPAFFCAAARKNWVAAFARRPGLRGT